MKKLIYSCLGTVCLLALSSCESPGYYADDDDDDDDDGRGRRSTIVTEETVRTSPYGAVQTTRPVYVQPVY